MLFLKETVILKKKVAENKKHEKLPSMQKVNDNKNAVVIVVNMKESD